ncbi:hypothetical protein [Nonomuraea sp. NPDC049504]|uniref:hypothetical protein n=1 Tax=Nonomuraea sp. NPDC049504 TaxID=3154729 RepID=UPI003436074E
MSHKRSGLLSGLFIGLLAALVCAAGLGAAVLYQESLPEAVMSLGGGVPISLALSLLIALLVTLAMGAVRPRSLLLVPLAAVYAGGAVAAGQITGSSVLIGAGLRTPGERTPADLSDVSLPVFNQGLPYALRVYREPLAETWPAWLYIAVAALAALVLLTLRVLRVRRAQRAETPDQPEDSSGEPEYRAPFEPAQQPAPKPTTDLFTPRKPARD